MMTWYQILSFFFTNGLRMVLDLYLVVKLLELTGDVRKAGVFILCAAAFLTGLFCFPVRQFYLMGAEILILTCMVSVLFKGELRMCLFLTFFYEIAVALWEFILSAGLGVLFQSEHFLDVKSLEYAIAVWIVRLLMLGIAFVTVKEQANKSRKPSPIITGAAIAGLFGVVTLSGQNTITIREDILTTWTTFSMLILMAILFFHLNRQYEMEKRVAELEKEKNVLLERDYHTLRNTYAANAKLFHDFHNHMNALYRYLSQNRTAEAMDYMENLHAPMKVTAQTAWTGDEAADYLINSKLSLAASQKIRTNVNIEFPRHTNIRSVDLVAILGNLLDNAFEAMEDAKDSLRFIHLTIRRINEMLVIKVENGCGAAPTIRDGALQTSKADKSIHGWGLRSVRTVAERYDGIMETEYCNHTFCVVVTLSFETIKTE